MTLMIEVVLSKILRIIGVQAFDMLPRLAILAGNRVVIVIAETADAVDGVVFVDA